MALKRYILKQDFKAPYMRITGNPRRPGKLCGVPYKKGDIITGELKHANDKPAFVLVMRDNVQLPFPVNMVTEVTEKEIGASEEPSSNASGSEKTLVDKVVSKNPKIQYLDSSIVGLLVGLGAVHLIHKKGWLTQDKKNYWYGAAIGALAGLYLVYRIKNSKKAKKE